MSNILGLVVRFGMRTTLWFRHSREDIGKEDDGGIWIEFFCIFYYIFFSCIFWRCTLSRFNISPLPFAKKIELVLYEKVFNQ